MPIMHALSMLRTLPILHALSIMHAYAVCPAYAACPVYAVCLCLCYLCLKRAKCRSVKLMTAAEYSTGQN